jgi:glycosyltransferase involved in cell wall biosynthesis
MKLLIVSPFVDPEAVGEPRWCYDLAKGLSERVDSAIIAQTPMTCQSSIAELFPHATVHESPGWKLGWMNGRIRQLLKPAYVSYYRFASRVIRQHYPPGSVDCAHHFGPLALRYPTPLHNSGIPYVMGPLGGSLKLPKGFGEQDRREPWYYRLRDFDRLRFQYDPLLRASYGNAACLVGIGDYVRDLLGSIRLRRFATFTETTAPSPPADIDTRVATRPGRSGSIRFLIVSRQIFSKGVHLALRAAAEASRHLPDWQLDILGDGPYRSELEKLAHSLGISDRVAFHGHVSRAIVNDFYDRADVFLFPSIREPSGVVMFEAMSWGLPMVVADYGGPAVHSDPSFSISIAVEKPDDFVHQLSKAIVRLAESPERRLKMGEAALRFVRHHYSIDAMVSFYLDLYRSIYSPTAD